MSMLNAFVKGVFNRHSTFAVLLLVLPLGAVQRFVSKVRIMMRKPSIGAHQSRVLERTSVVRRYAQTQSLDIEDRAAERALFDHQNMDQILGLDTDLDTVKVEPGVCVGQLVDFLLAHNAQLWVTPELKEQTIAALVEGVVVGSHSHVDGFVSDTVAAYELITASGQVLRVEPDGEHRDLFRAIPMSFGSLGVLTAIELRIKPAPTHVRVVYKPFHDRDAFVREYRRLLVSSNRAWGLEAIVFSPDQAVIVEAHLATPMEVASRRYALNDVAAWNQPMFYKHVESMIVGGCQEECVPIASYFFRHNRSQRVSVGAMIPAVNERWFRALLGWALPVNKRVLNLFMSDEFKARHLRQSVHKTVAVPEDYFTAVLEQLDEVFSIYPVLINGCHVTDRGAMLRLHGAHGTPWVGGCVQGAFITMSINGVPKEIVQGSQKYPTITYNRNLESSVRECGGFVIGGGVDSGFFCGTKEDFESMFDHSLWYEMCEQYDSSAVFATPFEKAKFQPDPASFLGEEIFWLAANNADAGIADDDYDSATTASRTEF